MKFIVFACFIALPTALYLSHQNNVSYFVKALSLYPLLAAGSGRSHPACLLNIAFIVNPHKENAPCRMHHNWDISF